MAFSLPSFDLSAVRRLREVRVDRAAVSSAVRRVRAWRPSTAALRPLRGNLTVTDILPTDVLSPSEAVIPPGGPGDPVRRVRAAGLHFAVGLLWLTARCSVGQARASARAYVSQPPAPAPAHDRAALPVVPREDLFTSNLLPTSPDSPPEEQVALGELGAGHCDGDPVLAVLLAQRKPAGHVAFCLRLDDGSVYFLALRDGEVRPGTDQCLPRADVAIARLHDWVKLLQQAGQLASAQVFASPELDLVNVDAHRSSLADLLLGVLPPVRLASIHFRLTPRQRRKLFTGLAVAVPLSLAAYFGVAYYVELRAAAERAARLAVEAAQVPEVFRDPVPQAPWEASPPALPSEALRAVTDVMLAVPASTTAGRFSAAYRLARMVGTPAGVSASYDAVIAPPDRAAAGGPVLWDPTFQPSPLPVPAPDPSDAYAPLEYTPPPLEEGQGGDDLQAAARAWLVERLRPLDEFFASRFALHGHVAGTTFGLTEHRGTLAWAVQMVSYPLPFDVLSASGTASFLDSVPGLYAVSVELEPPWTWTTTFAIALVAPPFAVDRAIEPNPDPPASGPDPAS